MAERDNEDEDEQPDWAAQFGQSLDQDKKQEEKVNNNDDDGENSGFDDFEDAKPDDSLK